MMEAGYRRSDTCCCVVGCNNSYNNTNKNIKFYTFPGKWYEKERRQIWINSVRRCSDSKESWEQKNYHRICSKHFVNGEKSNISLSPSYNPTIFPSVCRSKCQNVDMKTRRLVRAQSRSATIGSRKLKRLKRSAIPTQKIPDESHGCIKQKTNKKRVNTSDKDMGVYLPDGAHDEKLDLRMKNDVQSYEDLETTNTVENYTDIQDYTHLEPLYADTSTQADFCNFFKLPKILNSYEKLSIFIGVDSEVLQTYKNCVENFAIHNEYHDNENLELRIILVLCKLKRNISFACLSILFNCPQATCQRYFYCTVVLLSASIKSLIYWPNREDVLRSMPKCFENYNNTRLILDIMELKMNEHNCLKSRGPSYSRYQGGHIIKYLIGITPSGLISHVSGRYGGCRRNEAIFKKENIIERLEPDDAVMVDAGFSIEKQCEASSITLIRSSREERFSKSDASMATARVHVEKVIEIIKSFSIVGQQIDWYLLPYIDDIINIIITTVNLSPPVPPD